MRILGVLAILAPLSAHDLYLMPDKTVVEPGTKVVMSIHVGDSFPKSEGPADPGRIVDSRMSDGTPIEGWQILGRATHAVVSVAGTGSRWAGAATKPRTLGMPAEKFAAYLKEEGLDGVAAWRQKNGEAERFGRERYTKFAKALVVGGRPDEGWKKTLGYAIEIVPEKDPGAMRVGERLPVRVVFRGKAAAGVQVMASWEGGNAVVGRTDAAGRVSVPIGATGRWRLHALTMERAAPGGEVDWESYWASMTFGVR